MRRTAAALLLVSAFAAPSLTLAESDLTISLGVRLGGEVEASFTPTQKLDTTPSIGLTFDKRLAPEKWVTVLWSFQNTEFDAPVLVPQGQTFELGIHYLQAGGMYRPERGQKGVEPFVAVTGGLTWIDPGPSGFDSAFGLGMMIGGGAKFPLSKRLAFRLDGRVYINFAATSIRGVCGGVGCSVELSGTGALQFEGLAGLTVDF